MNKIAFKLTGAAFAAILSIATIFDGYYTIQEGTAGIDKRMGKVIGQTGPGLHFKIPFVDTVKKIDIRTRLNTESMTVATKEQMKATAKVSVNWTANQESVKELYSKYGGLEQFESKVLDPKIRAEAKKAISKFSAEENINTREAVTNVMLENITSVLNTFPITIDSVQYEEINLPTKYLESIDTKQTAKNLRDAEQYNLEKQNLTAQQAVNTAKASAESITVTAQAEAQATILKGDAEASAIKAKASALKNNPLIVDLTKAQNWNGVMPATMVGSNTPMIMKLN